MSQVSEIKCPSCGQWSQWTNRIDAKCPHCGAYLDPMRVEYAEERRLNTERARRDSYLVIQPNEDPVVGMFKQFINWLRWGTLFGVSVIFFIIFAAVIVYGLIML